MQSILDLEESIKEILVVTATGCIQYLRFSEKGAFIKGKILSFKKFESFMVTDLDTRPNTTFNYYPSG